MPIIEFFNFNSIIKVTRASMGLYDYISDIQDKDKFKFFVVLIVSLFFATTIFPIELRHISGLLLAVIIIYYLNDQNLSSVDDFNRETEAKLNAIKNATRTTPRIGGINAKFGVTDPSVARDIRTQLLSQNTFSTSAVDGFVPSYLHHDADIINFLFFILDFREYNPTAFLEIVKSIDHLLKIEDDVKIGVQECAENLEIANKFKNLAMNHMQSFIYTLPSAKVTNNKMKESMKRLQLLSRRHIDTVFRICKESQRKNGLNYRSRPLYNGGPRPNDMDSPEFLLNFDIYN